MKKNLQIDYEEDKWEKLKTPMIVTGFNNEKSMIIYKAKNVKIQIWDKILILKDIYCFDCNKIDILLGTSFLKELYPHIITKTYWWFTTPNGHKIGAKRVKNKQRKPKDWIKGSKQINQKMEIEYAYILVKINSDNYMMLLFYILEKYRC